MSSLFIRLFVNGKIFGLTIAFAAVTALAITEIIGDDADFVVVGIVLIALLVLRRARFNTWKIGSMLLPASFVWWSSFIFIKTPKTDTPTLYLALTILIFSLLFGLFKVITSKVDEW